MIKPLLAAALLALAAPLPAMAGPGQPGVTLTFTGVKAHQGKVLIAIYDEAGWAGGKPVRVAIADASGAEVAAKVEGLAPGRYGVKAFHDVDGDGKMGMNPFGIPLEPFGFSRDAVGLGGPAAWADAAFAVTAGDAVQTITLR
ncbi:DUF2141 domain-containing protein [Sphingomonas sp. LM7]|uniref:DUF2141 domain-containing protein n=1 Tax=Sphingomonas sp. LM7 TaxID=1938607 RepID=UPI000983E345|nr:DUF2141 domain-containing protein [Sphingomonas sp. LM7]AQR74957.1 hypothetical protein BXU08_15950 [Sphingomonas sp. LM7]